MEAATQVDTRYPLLPRPPGKRPSRSPSDWSWLGQERTNLSENRVSSYLHCYGLFIPSAQHGRTQVAKIFSIQSINPRHFLATSPHCSFDLWLSAAFYLSLLFLYLGMCGPIIFRGSNQLVQVDPYWWFWAGLGSSMSLGLSYEIQA